MRLLISLLTLAFMSHAALAEPLQKWVYVARNLWVDQNIADLDQLFRRAAKAGYTHILLTDSKFGKLNEMDARYFRNVEKVKGLASELNLEIVPAVFPIGYSNDILWHDPNLIEALPVRDAEFQVKDGLAHLIRAHTNLLKGSDLANLKLWSWHDPNVVSTNGAVLIRNPNGENARLVQKLSLTPFRQYHLTVRIKTEDFKGTPEVKVLAPKGALNYNYLGVKPSQEWTVHHVLFNSLENTAANLYLGTWGGGTGSVWFDDVTLEETALVNLVRRPGAPLLVKDGNGRKLEEGKDFEKLIDPKMGNKMWPGSYDVFHEPPQLKSSLPDGTRLSVSFYHAVTVHDDQAMICPSEPRTIELLRDQAERVHKTWGAKGYMMSHDEIRVLNWCQACQERDLDAGQMLAANVRQCAEILKRVNPGGRIYVWSDMFDPHHNAHKDYYLVRGDLKGSWEGLDKDVIIVPWYFDKRNDTLRFFADRGHKQLIAGYYDAHPEKIQEWILAANQVQGVEGVIYTTWENKYGDLEKFAEFVRRSEGN